MESKKKKEKEKNSNSKRTDQWLPEVGDGGWRMGEKAGGAQKIQTSSYK